MSDEKPMIGRCLNCDAKFELSNSAAMDVIRERDKLSAELAELKHKFDEQYSHDTKALDAVHRERDQLKAELAAMLELAKDNDDQIAVEMAKADRLEAELAECRADLDVARKQCQMTNSNWPHEKKLHDEIARLRKLLQERDALKAKLERAKARFIEIENLDPIHERERRTIAREGRKEIEGKP